AVHNYASAGKNATVLPPMQDVNTLIGGYVNFWGSIFPQLEQDTVINKAMGSGNLAGNGNATGVVIQALLCPSDPTHANGYCTTGAIGWGGTSYAPNYLLFAGNTLPISAYPGYFKICSTYNLAGIPHGTSNQIAAVEHFTSFKAATSY